MLRHIVSLLLPELILYIYQHFFKFLKHKAIYLIILVQARQLRNDPSRAFLATYISNQLFLQHEKDDTLQVYNQKLLQHHYHDLQVQMIMRMMKMNFHRHRHSTSLFIFFAISTLNYDFLILNCQIFLSSNQMVL